MQKQNKVLLVIMLMAKEYTKFVHSKTHRGWVLCNSKLLMDIKCFVLVCSSHTLQIIHLRQSALKVKTACMFFQFYLKIWKWFVQVIDNGLQGIHCDTNNACTALPKTKIGNKNVTRLVLESNSQLIFIVIFFSQYNSIQLALAAANGNIIQHPFVIKK